VPDIGFLPASPVLLPLSEEEGVLHLQAVFEGIGCGLISIDRECRLRVANAAAGEILRLGPGATTSGTALPDSLGTSSLLDRAAAETIHTASVATAADGRPRTVSLTVGTPQRQLAVEVCHLPDGTSLLRIDDVTERCNAEALAFRQAQNDPLTGLPGRQLFFDHLAQRLACLAGGSATGGTSALAILMIDLDRFKSVNDTLGHPVGDEVLRLVARRMRTTIRDSDMLTRFGGDEFGLLIEGRDAEQAAAIGRRLLEIVGRPYLACGHLVNVGASIGIACAPDHTSDAATLLRYADLALYSVKTAGRNGCAFFSPAMDARAHARRTLEIDLRRALTLCQFEVHFQPQVALHGNRLCGFEALMRWRHPERGLVPPADFIPLAEEIGLIGAIGEWILVNACREAASWPEALTLAVNVSGRQFEDGRLVDTVRRVLATTGLAGNRLELEITESVLMCNENAVLGMLRDLRALGVRVAMDDFGTGYSSLSQLRSFPFDKIKIDKSFIRQGETLPTDTAIIRAITAMGASLGMATVAEGVETEEELAQIRAEGCDVVQGYLFSRPVPAADLPALIATFAESGCTAE